MKISQCGRSMVEMLGVLAIIGVLSVGAIAGYSSAMTKIKKNKHTSQINQILNVVYRHLDEIKRQGHSYNWFPVFIKMGEFPEDMYTSKSSTSLKDVFKSTYTFMYHDTGYIGIFSQLNKGPNSQMACENVYEVAKEWHEHLRSVQILLGNGTYPESASYYGKTLCKSNNKCLKDLTVEKIAGVCNVCEEGKLCRLLFRFK